MLRHKRKYKQLDPFDTPKNTRAHFIVGGGRCYGRAMLIIHSNKKELDQFRKFCSKHGLDPYISVWRVIDNDTYLVSCDRNSYRAFMSDIALPASGGWRKLEAKRPDNSITILAISDLHHWTVDEIDRAGQCEFDVCVLCGDIPVEAIRQIKNIVGDRPLLGVPGNHDEWNTVELGGAENINGILFNYHNISFLGFGGSVRYKCGDYPMFSQKEALRQLISMPKADILISHKGMYKLFGKDKAHCGFLGITWYMLKNRVKLNICGHHHMMKIKRRLGIDTLCVYRCALISYPNKEVIRIF